MASDSESSSTTSSDGEEILDYSFLKKQINAFEEVDSDEENFAAEETVDPGKEFQNVPYSLEKDSVVEVFGTVYSILPPYFVVSPKSTTAILDLGSYVIDPSTKVIIGLIWDVFGPVKNPLYSVLVRDDVIQGITAGMEVALCPKFIKLVSKESLAEDKGVDADPGQVEFSDDEEERAYHKKVEPGEL